MKTAEEILNSYLTLSSGTIQRYYPSIINAIRHAQKDALKESASIVGFNPETAEWSINKLISEIK